MKGLKIVAKDCLHVHNHSRRFCAREAAGISCSQPVSFVPVSQISREYFDVSVCRPGIIIKKSFSHS